jgi:RHS repeat-associated protein
MPLTVNLTYNSNAAAEDGSFGYGWRMNYDMHIVNNFPVGEWTLGAEGGRELEGTPYIELHRETGAVKIFDISKIETNSREYLPKSGSYETIIYYPAATPDPYYIRELKNGTQYRFNEAGYLVSIEDANGNEITINRYANGGINSVTDASGLRTVDFDNPSGDSKIEKITGPDGTEYTFEYSGDDLVSYQAPAMANPVEMEYDSSHRMTSRSDAYGNTVDYTYNDDGLIESRTDQNQYTRTYSYEDTGTIAYDPKGYRTVAHINNDADITRITWEEFKGGVWHIVKERSGKYGATGKLIEFYNGYSNPARYEYDGRDNLTAKINAQGIKATFDYDEYNNVTLITQAKGTSVERTFAFDYGVDPSLRNVEEISWEVDGTTYSRSYEYNTDGSLKKYTNALGKEYDFTYTSYGNLETITNPLNNAMDLDYYDEMGELSSITNALGFTTEYSYLDGCACNPLTRVDYPDGTFTEFSRNYKRIISITDRNGYVAGFPEYDGKSQLKKLIDAIGNITEFTYDENENLETIRDANTNITSYEYDAVNRLTRTIYPDSSFEAFTYDAADNITSKTLLDGSIIEYDYDSLNRLTIKTYPDITTVDYDYDDLGRLTDIENYYYALHYEYDEISRVEWFSCTDKDIGEGYKVEYEYDAEGNRTALTYPSGYEISATYDDLNRLNQIKDPDDKLLADYDYDAMRRTGVTLFNAGTEVTFTSYTYDDANDKPDHLITLSNWKAGTDIAISTFNYTYDVEGNRLSMEVGPAWESQTGEHDYDYDDIYQLTEVDVPQFAAYSDTTFTYDSMGNRLKVTFSGQSEIYDPNELNQYDGVDDIEYSYDENGNLADDDVQTYYYDLESRLTRAVRNSDGQTLAEYRYDPFGRRAKKITDNGTTVANYLYDGVQVIEERNGDFELENRFVYGPGIDEPLTMYDAQAAKTYFYQRDGLGSVTEITDDQGNVVEHCRYSPYGKLKIYNSSWSEISASSAGNPYYFTGRRFDEETGLYYYRARMYSAEIGRFLQTDPLGYLDGPNLYRYARNSPVNLIDPIGFAPCTNNSGRPVPYKPEGVDHKPPSIAEPGETVDADGIYSPAGTVNPIVVKIPNNARAVINRDGQLYVYARYYPYGLGKALWKLTSKYRPKIVGPETLSEGDYKNWPNPYSGEYWPYQRWTICE